MKITKRKRDIMELKEKAFFSKLLAVLLLGVSVAVLIMGEFESDAIYFILILLAVSVIIFVTEKNVHIIIDKSMMIIDINKESVLKKRRKRIDLNELDHINVKETRNVKHYSDDTREVRYKYEIFLVLKDASKILLNHQSSSGKFFFIKLKSKDQKTGEKIAEFLNVPCKKTSR